MVWLPDGEKRLRICLIVLTEHRRVSDRQTDRQTSCNGIVRVIHTRRAVKIINFMITCDNFWLHFACHLQFYGTCVIME